jgi:membrane-associated protein
MELIHSLIGAFRQLTSPDSLNALAQALGPWMYVLLFAIIFAETGLVVTPFLPGDSLLFAVGAVAAYPSSPINWPLTAALLIAAAVLGDAVNYAIGHWLGPKVFHREDSKLLNKHHLLRAQAFYERHGGKTIVLARFVPIIRTFAPFVAGIGKMRYWQFAVYNVSGAILWVLLCLGAGYFFGRLEFVQKHFELVLIAIVAISLVPVAWELWRARIAAAEGRSALLEATTIGESIDDPPIPVPSRDATA